MLEKALKAAQAGVKQSDADLFEELRIPSVSALPEHRADVRRNAEWLIERLQKLGFKTSLTDVEGGRHPVLQADLVLDPKLPTLTIYGHYDVQPPDPLDLWVTPPFDPQIRKGPDGKDRIFARGASDDNGQLLTFLEASRAWLAVHGRLPFRL